MEGCQSTFLGTESKSDATVFGPDGGADAMVAADMAATDLGADVDAGPAIDVPTALDLGAATDLGVAIYMGAPVDLGTDARTAPVITCTESNYPGGHFAASPPLRAKHHDEHGTHRVDDGNHRHADHSHRAHDHWCVGHGDAELDHLLHGRHRCERSLRSTRRESDGPASRHGGLLRVARRLDAACERSGLSHVVERRASSATSTRVWRQRNGRS